ncbi:MAG: nucleoside-diphosphate sugar epimerase [Gammaproteobacteria bacterium]|nr:nucleoside-diphosphate sugar epimerase [Gammaproteobacteria bacterium]NIR98367.1 nucleoside-diphosphate sugar epimerase [Gammaproteobacteria bacterium]NIT64904.1 nucleoside-diphosphate sugar epimerase [Gammaproteobacteria bacterium]NIV21058.1 nucleoside-diphosphate sugar epimerase [Gammaproteobacteria bacterium]NIY33484.1 nucleoside-diphosphate sugar epimerase [Gammaproteobacteria bacterium]
MIWRFTDGKPGHEGQSEGLANALAERLAVQVHTLAPPSALHAAAYWFNRRFPPARACPDPDLLVGAGHATHLPMLAARRARGGHIVVLMRPSLPCAWFDLCVIPEHDRPDPAANVLTTRGALNRITETGPKEAGLGLLLIGGPSAHYGWDEGRLAEQVRTVAAGDGRHWRLTTSRRTPRSTVQRLRNLGLRNLEVVPAEQTGPNWLPRQLARAPTAWVTADSVSMVYEVLTAGAACGLLEVPARRASRVGEGVQQLVADGWVTPFGAWRSGEALASPPAEFNEARRCARWIHEHLLGP